MVKCSTRLVLLIFWITMSPSRGEDLETLLSKHESTRESLRAFHVKIDAYGPKQFAISDQLLKFLTDDKKDLPLAYRADWIVDGTNEKITYTPVIDNVHNGLPANYFELIFRDGKEYLLENWDRANPQTISPSFQGSVRAYISLQKKDFNRKDPGMQSLFLPRVQMNEPRLSLRQFVDRFADKEIVSNSDTAITVRLKNDSAGILNASQYMEVTLSKEYGYLASSIVLKEEKEIQAAELGKSASSIEFRVVEFQDLGDGVFFPSITEYTITDAYKKTVIKMLRCQFHIESVNEEIAEDMFTMQFPKDVLVVDSSIDPKTVKWLLWGEGNKPAQEVKNKSELRLLNKKGAK